ncbi:hypothetical protein BKA64DRAFT_689565 [Cadophora sp. MPI-SDFR-AT-0126]|nr:hypothetical protein BKA64DRAFT_689565 [Leotiomycetes sp. MPI-SDFR-AT-0126]
MTSLVTPPQCHDRQGPRLFHLVSTMLNSIVCNMRCQLDDHDDLVRDFRIETLTGWGSLREMVEQACGGVLAAFGGGSKGPDSGPLVRHTCFLACLSSSTVRFHIYVSRTSPFSYQSDHQQIHIFKHSHRFPICPSTTNSNTYFNAHQASRDYFFTSQEYQQISHHTSLHNVFQLHTTPVALLIISGSRVRHAAILHSLGLHTRNASTHQEADGSRLTVSQEEESQLRGHKRIRQTRSVRQHFEYG